MEPVSTGEDFAAWFTGLISQYPAAYATIDAHLKQVMPDTKDFLNESTGRDSRSLVVRFQTPEAEIRVPLNDLSDGEKCLFISAVVLAANQSYAPLFFFWDEPDYQVRRKLTLHQMNNSALGLSLSPCERHRSFIEYARRTLQNFINTG